MADANDRLRASNKRLQSVNSAYEEKNRALSELNQDMEHLLEGADVAIIYLDRDLRIRKLTPRVTELFGLNDGDLGSSIDALSGRIGYGSLVESVKEVLASGQRSETEFHSAGGACYLTRILPYRVDGRIEGAVISLVDVTVLDQARGEILQLSAIVESSTDAIIGKALDGAITSWNAGAERLFGYTAQEAIGRNIFMLVPEKDRARVQQWMGQLARGVRIEPIEVERKAKDGRRVYVSITVSPIKDSRGNVVGASTIARDVAELRRIRLASEATDQRIRLLLESTAEAIYGLDTQGNCTFVNPACLAMLGYDSADELLGKNMHVMIHHTRSDGSEYRVEDCTIYQAYRRGERIYVEEELLWRKDGGSIYVELWSHPMVENGEAVGAVTTFLDITRRKRAVEKLREEVRRRERFLAMLSHELRNPLSAVRTAARVLNSADVNADADAQARQIIERQTAQMTRLIDDLLDVSRITQNKINLARNAFDLCETVEDAVQSVRALAREEQVVIDVSRPDKPLWVDGDAARLQQVQANLLGNAVKFSPPGERVQIALAADDGAAVIRVADRGAGIPPDMLQQIFEPFVQSDETLDRSQGGMGVGLTLVRELVRMHGGTVSAESAGRGCGSTFEVRLPLADPGAVVASPPIADSPSDGQRRRVVVIEDQDDNRQMLTTILELEGFDVLGAASGDEGLKLIEESSPEIAVVDIGLPGIDGYEVARRVRASSSPLELTLIALTGYGQEQDVQQARQAGFNHHLVKPLEPDRLIAVLRTPKDAAAQ